MLPFDLDGVVKHVINSVRARGFAAVAIPGRLVKPSSVEMTGAMQHSVSSAPVVSFGTDS